MDLEADIAVKMIDIRRQIDNAILNRTGAITKVVTEAKVLQKTVIRERDLNLIELEKDIEVAKRNRTLKVIEASNQRKEAEIRFERELLQAESESLIMAMEADARSYETVSNGTAKSNDLKYKYDAQLQLFKALKNSTNMSSAELLQYVWLQTMRKTSSGDLFVDYKKVHFLLR